MLLPTFTFCLYFSFRIYYFSFVALKIVMPFSCFGHTITKTLSDIDIDTPIQQQTFVRYIGQNDGSVLQRFIIFKPFENVLLCSVFNENYAICYCCLL